MKFHLFGNRKKQEYEEYENKDFDSEEFLGEEQVDSDEYHLENRESEEYYDDEDFEDLGEPEELGGPDDDGEAEEWESESEIMDSGNYEDDTEPVITDPQQRILHDLHALMEEENEQRDDSIVIPGWKITIWPRLAQLKDQMAVIDFHICYPFWDRAVYECSAALGKDQNQAVGMAEGGFLLGIMSGIRSMMNEYETDRVETEFSGLAHRWKVYRSDLVGMGETPRQRHAPDFWGLLKEDICKRLGNQKLCYVKIFGAKNGDVISGECRINDVKNEELSTKIKEVIGRWNTDGYGSQKQFFFCVQDDVTYIPYPYTRDQLKEFMIQAVELFISSKTQEEYGQYVERLAKIIGDSDLAEEFFAFLPEFCAEHAFDQLIYPDHIVICQGEGRRLVYKEQMAGYRILQDLLLEGFETGELSNDTYRDYVSMSSIYNVICNAKEEGTDLLQDGGEVVVSYNFSSGYRVR